MNFRNCRCQRPSANCVFWKPWSIIPIRHKTDGKDEAIEIFRLTCLEEGVRVENAPSSLLPEVRADGARFVVEWPEAG